MIHDPTSNFPRPSSTFNRNLHLNERFVSINEMADVSPRSERNRVDRLQNTYFFDFTETPTMIVKVEFQRGRRKRSSPAFPTDERYTIPRKQQLAAGSHVSSNKFAVREGEQRTRRTMLYLAKLIRVTSCRRCRRPPPPPASNRQLFHGLI